MNSILASLPVAFLGGAEILILALALLVLFYGPKKIPELARSTGQATQELKKGREQVEEELEEMENTSESQTRN